MFVASNNTLLCRWTAFLLWRKVRLFGLACCFAVSAEAYGQAAQDRIPLTVCISSGSVIQVEVPDRPLEWTDLSMPGRFAQRTIRFTEIRQLVLAKDAISDQLTATRQHLANLQSDDYLLREAAEKELSKAESGGPFRSLIEAEKEHEDLEVRYRVQRILGELAKANTPKRDAYDRIETADGRWLTGNVGDFSIRCQYRGQEIVLGRQEIDSLHRSAPVQPTQVSEAGSAVVKVFQRFADFENNRQTLIDFQHSPSGEELLTRADVSDLYVSSGLRMSSAKTGFIGISGYAFRSDNPPEGNSICVFEPSGSSFSRYKGTMEFRFCMPHQKSVAAGVHEFGLFASRVDMPRDMIMEAYNVDGFLLATVEASDANCTFHGIKSTDPIAFVRFRSNPYLYNVNRKVDEDYCIDDVRFSTPVRLSTPDASSSAGIVLGTGEQLMGKFEIRDQEVAVQWGSGRIARVPLGEISSIHFSNAPEPPAKGQRVWHAMLGDQTIIEVAPEQNFGAPWFGGFEVEPSEIAALWLAPNELRFPLEGDLDWLDSPEQAVMVNPVCRLLAEGIQMNGEGYRWNRAQKVEQDLWIKAARDRDETERSGATKEGQASEENEIQFQQASPERVPTLWLQSPPKRNPPRGKIFLVDGQQFSIGAGADIAMENLNNDSVTLRRQQQSEQIPLEKVLKIEFPGG